MEGKRATGRRWPESWLPIGLAATVALAGCAPAPSPSSAAPTPTPSPTPVVAQRVDLFIPDISVPVGQMAIVDDSGLFHSGTSDASRPGPEGEDIWVLAVPGQPNDLAFGWWNVGHYCHGNPSVLTIVQPAPRTLRFTFDRGPALNTSCLAVGIRFGVLLRFTTDVSGYSLSATFAPEQTPPPSPSP
jgi:hypothetical protein